MILTSNNRINKLLIIITALVFLQFPFFVFAQGLELSVSPTLFEMSALPGQVWNSQVKVINSNKQPLTVYAKVVNFAPKGEYGEGKFTPVLEEMTEGKTLAEWIEITPDSIVVPPETSENIPFKVAVPSDASPGGHFAAIMIGTKPPENERMRISTSQVVTSLFFVRVAGDVIEEGAVREFNTEKRFVSEPMADFTLRFENKGNVHIQPQGQIEITNMWGKERGVIPINHQTHFGNVLPNSVRKFEFTWNGEMSLMDIGRYKASVTLGYGMEGRKSATSVTYFYVVPVKSISLFLLAFIFIIWFVKKSIKAYVRRMLVLSGVDVDTFEENIRDRQSRNFVREGDILIQKKSTSVRSPITSGFTDLLTGLNAVTDIKGKLVALLEFIVSYKKFFTTMFVVVLIIFAITYFVRDVNQPVRDYSVVIENPDQDVMITSEDIIYNNTEQGNNIEKAQTETVINEATSTSAIDQLYRLELVNAGSTPGAAAAIVPQRIALSKPNIYKPIAVNVPCIRAIRTVPVKTERTAKAILRRISSS
jgi:hypothetical protein